MIADRWFGIAFIMVAAGMALATMQIETPFASLGDPGPKLVPFILSAGLGLLGLLLVLRRRKRAEASVSEPGGQSTEGGVEMLAPPSGPVQTALAVAFVAYIAFFERLGFTLATFMFLVVAMVLLAPRTPRSIVVSVGLSAALTLAVGGFLAGVIGVPLPGVLVP
jgi:MYXO-CTERM domain-containing protein